jgi:hypothetical protein
MGSSDSDKFDGPEWTRRQLLVRGGPVISAVMALIGCRRDVLTGGASGSEPTEDVPTETSDEFDADVAVAAFSVPAGEESEYVRIVVQRWSDA